MSFGSLLHKAQRNPLYVPDETNVEVSFVSEMYLVEAKRTALIVQEKP